MIEFDVVIYESAMTMLLGEKIIIKDEILSQLQQGDAVLDEIAEELADICEEDEDIDEEEAEAIVEGFTENDCEDLMPYISFSEEDIEFDYDESVAAEDRDICAFRIPCTFDAERYILATQGFVMTPVSVPRKDEE